MLLQDLPPEVLDEITRRLPSSSVVDLLLVGAKSLSYRLLEVGGVSVLDFQDSWSVVGPPPSWPQALISRVGPHLRHLVLKDVWSRPVVDVSVEDVLSLPSGVRTLDFSFANALPLLLCAFSRQISRFSHLSTLLIEGTHGRLEPTAKWKLPPSLTRLHLSGAPDLAPALLPASLTDLHLNCARLLLLDLDTALPHHLTRLELTTSRTCDWISLLPPGLTSCTIYCVDPPPEYPTEHWKHLPQQLRSLTCDIHVVTEAALDNLPKTLTHLFLQTRSATTYNNNWLAHLPPNLTFLAGVLIPPHIDETLAKRLPRTLATGRLHADLASLPHLPTNTKFVHLVPYHSQSPQYVYPKASELKSFLTSSIQSMLGHGDIHTLLHSFPQLVRLRITSYSKVSFPEELAEIIPRSVRTLYIRDAPLGEAALQKLPPLLEELESSGKNLFESEECLKVLPQSLTSIRGAWHNAPLTPHSASWWPHGLKRLFLHELSGSIGSEWISGLPDSIEALTLSIPSWTEDDAHCEPNFPSSLTDLTLSINKGRFSVLRMLMCLPRGITQAHIFFNDSKRMGEQGGGSLDSSSTTTNRNTTDWLEVIRPEHVATHIPPKIVNLSLPSNVTVDEACGDLMPISLQRLHCGQPLPSWTGGLAFRLNKRKKA